MFDGEEMKLLTPKDLILLRGIFLMGEMSKIFRKVFARGVGNFNFGGGGGRVILLGRGVTLF